MMADLLRPIGTIIKAEFPPDYAINDWCGQHGHFWKYKISGHVKIEKLDGIKEVETVEPIERICKDQWFYLERGER